MSNVLEINDQEELESLINSAHEVVVDFSAPAWCPPCQQLEPHFEAAADKSDATFVMVDVDNAPWVMEEYGVRGVPTVMHFVNGEYNKNIQGRTAVKILGELA